MTTRKKKTQPIKVEAGKSYTTTEGNRFECWKVDFPITDKAIGIILADAGWHWFVYDPSCGTQLTGPWVDKPTIDWSKLPAWAEYVAMDEYGWWFWYDKKPDCFHVAWFPCGKDHGTLPPQYCPKGTFDWKQTLIKRP